MYEISKQHYCIIVSAKPENEPTDNGKSSSLPRPSGSPSMKDNKDEQEIGRPPMIRSFTLADPLIKPE